MPNVVDIRAEIIEIKKIIMELYERPNVAEPVGEVVIFAVKVPNI